MASKVRLILQGVTRKCTNCCCCCLPLHHLYWIFLLFLALARKLISPSTPILFLLIELPNKTPVRRDKLFQQSSNGTNIPSTQWKDLFFNEIIIHVSIQSIVLCLININKSITPCPAFFAVVWLTLWLMLIRSTKNLEATTWKCWNLTENLKMQSFFFLKDNRKNVATTEAEGKSGWKPVNQVRGPSCQMVCCTYFSTLALFRRPVALSEATRLLFAISTDSWSGSINMDGGRHLLSCLVSLILTNHI